MDDTQTCGAAAQPSKEHGWLAQLLGEWTFQAEAVMGPDQPPMKSSGSESVRSLGGIWVVCDGRGEAPGGSMESVMTLGYDPQAGRYVGTFIASPMTHLWIYNGSLDKTGKRLTLDTEGPGMNPNAGLMPYRDVIEIVSPDERTLTSYARGEDGVWVRFMRATYTRSSFTG